MEIPMKASKRIARILFVTACLAIGIFSVAALAPASNQSVALLVSGEMRELEAEGRQLDEALRIEIRAGRAKEDVAADVIAGRVRLLDAAALFNTVDAQLNPNSLRVRLAQIPGDSDAERECRKVIDAVDYALINEPSARELIVSRLKAELQNELDRSGAVQFPVSDTAATDDANP
jgi:hypothetical protein